MDIRSVGNTQNGLFSRLEAARKALHEGKISAELELFLGFAQEPFDWFRPTQVIDCRVTR